MMDRRLALGILMLLFAALPALAQTGGLTIQVLDSDGAPLPGATVSISHELSYVKTTAEVSDARGLVRFPILRPGRGYRAVHAVGHFAMHLRRQGSSEFIASLTN